MGSVVTPPMDDGSTVVSTSAYYGTVLDVEGIVKNENELIKRYRDTAKYADCDGAIEDIVNEAIISDGFEIPVKINLDNVKLSDAIKKKIREEHSNILRLYKFDLKGHDIFRQWYIDGRAYYQILVDEKDKKSGIQEIRYIDPRKIRRIKKVDKSRSSKGVEIVKQVEEFFLYNDKGIVANSTQGIKLPIESVVFCPSGIQDADNGMMLSALHKAIKPVNQLKMIEDAVVIYRISRAPERRVFYVDVGNLPKLKAEQYVNEIMNKFRNKIVYDATTGETRDDRRQLSMMEDFWMPRREGGKGTEITTLPGGQNLGDIQDIEYFQKKLYQALNVPMSRLQASEGFSMGRASEITRDEIKFSKFISRLRKRFSVLFSAALRIQLICKGIIKPDDWDEIELDITYDYQQDNHFNELKNAELLQNRINILQAIDPFVGKYYSVAWIRKNLLLQSPEEMEKIDKEIMEEAPPPEELASDAQSDNSPKKQNASAPEPAKSTIQK